MVRSLQIPVTAAFDAAEPWRVNLGDLAGIDAADDMRAHVMRVPAALRLSALSAETGRRASLTGSR
jgi:hypothetical protein